MAPLYISVPSISYATGERINLRYNKCTDTFWWYGWIVSPSVLLHASFDTDFDDQFRFIQLPAKPFTQDEYKSTWQSSKGICANLC